MFGLRLHRVRPATWREIGQLPTPLKFSKTRLIVVYINKLQSFCPRENLSRLNTILKNTAK